MTANVGELTVEYSLKPNDVYTPFQWDRYNVARWVVAVLLCLIFYDIWTSGSETLRSFPDSGGILALIAVLAVFILLALLLFPYLRVRALFRKTPSMSKITRVTFRAKGLLFQSEEATSEIKWPLTSQNVASLRGRMFLCFAT